MIHPLTNRILVRPIEPADGPIIIPEAYRLQREDEPIEAEVVGHGPQRITKRRRSPIPWETQPGDRVLLIGYMGAETQVDGQRHLIVKEQDILAIIGPRIVESRSGFPEATSTMVFEAEGNGRVVDQTITEDLR